MKSTRAIEKKTDKSSYRIWPIAARRYRGSQLLPTARQLATINDAASGLAAARNDPQIVVHIFERDWLTVDRLRQQVEAEGLFNRVTVRIMDALALLNMSAYDLIVENDM